MVDLSLSGKLKTQYKTGYPFPYIVIDDFLPEFLMNECLEELKKHQGWGSNVMKWIEEFEVNKFCIPHDNEDIESLRHRIPITTLIFDYLNTPEFLEYLEELTGIKKLYKDPSMLGGGVHKINQGGKLSIHKDYNSHPVTKHSRKLNLLIYLNKDWEENWGGNLELWKKDTSEKIIEIEPIFNRAVIFDIEDAPHGHPYPLNCPTHVSRYSLALYYFIEEIPENPQNVIFYRGKTSENIFKTN